MNILLINYEYPPIGAGAANATWNMANSFTICGHRLTVLTSAFQNYKGIVIENDVTVVRCPAIRRKQECSNIIEMFSFVVSALFYLPLIIK